MYYQNLKAECARNNISLYGDVAEAIGITSDAMYKREKNETEFSVSEAFAIQNKFFPSLDVKYLFG